MITRSVLADIVRDAPDLPVEESAPGTDFDQLPHGESPHVPRPLVGLERETGHRVSVGRLLTEPSPEGVYQGGVEAGNHR